ncbi:MAG: hypothetical protein WCL16_05670, partial [bacterium]
LMAVLLRHGLRTAIRRGVVLAAGAILGYLPMLAHIVFRAANWPFGNQLHAKIALSEVVDTQFRFFTRVAARIFGVHGDNPVFSAISLLWVAIALLAFAAAVRRKRSQPAQITALDAAWVIGSLGIILAMIATPVLVHDGSSRRYCLHVLPAVAWLFARFLPTSNWRRWLAAGLVLALAATSVPVWVHRLNAEALVEQSVRETKERFIPELMDSQAVILTDYWDAYLLAFLADGRIKVEAYPWDWVRTYGLVARDEMSRRTLWLVKSGYGRNTRDQLLKELGPGVLDRITVRNMRESLSGRKCQLWETGDSEPAAALMQKHQARYFSTHYPPGQKKNRAP